MNSNKIRSLAKLLILLSAFASMMLSIGLWFLAEDELAGIFVGLWVPSILALGAILLKEGSR